MARTPRGVHPGHPPGDGRGGRADEGGRGRRTRSDPGAGFRAGVAVMREPQACQRALAASSLALVVCSHENSERPKCP